MNYKLEQYLASFIMSLLVCLTALLMPSSAQALGLADIELHSALNQPLHATIPLSASKAELSLLKVSLASEKAFQRSGIPREKILNSMIIELIKKDQSPHIKITSKRLIREPMLEFILAIDSGNGRMFRNYSVFLSP